jgi:hypothetical protein
MHQSRPSRERRARQQGLVRLVRKKGVQPEKEDKVPTASLSGSQGPVHLERPNSRSRENRSVERKRERGLQRQSRNHPRSTTDYADLTDF